MAAGFKITCRTVDGRVTYGAFSLDLNPGAPSTVLPGTGPEIEKWARILAEQNEAIPVFIKKRANEWTYMGHYRCVSLSDDPTEIDAHATKTGRRDISMVLKLERDKSAEGGNG